MGGHENVIFCKVYTFFSTLNFFLDQMLVLYRYILAWQSFEDTSHFISRTARSPLTAETVAATRVPVHHNHHCNISLPGVRVFSLFSATCPFQQTPPYTLTFVVTLQLPPPPPQASALEANLDRSPRGMEGRYVGSVGKKGPGVSSIR